MKAEESAEMAMEKDPQFATTLARGIDILLSYRVGESVLGNREFVQRTGLSKTTVARLTHTLTSLGYLRHDVSLEKYRLGPAVLSMGYPLLANMQIRQIARPLMRELSEQTGGAVSLGIRDRIHMIYVETSRSTDRLVMTPDIGAPLPILTTAIGRAWLSRAPADERQAVLNQIRVKDPEHYQRFYHAAMQAVNAYEQRHYCGNRGEWRSDVYGFAVPLSRPVDSNLFVFNCGIPSSSGSYAAIEREVAPKLVSLVRSIEVILGFT
ncbi:IclR family transcriptional regulator [Herbaspirillum sp. GCM10030257]|uniref:IclR family transcriptional regulator n=1 Tax=Herbaspirillum sp. GCM10030257 TaxID=3273393 RepID=UPI00361D6034